MVRLKFHPGETVLLNFIIPFYKEDVAAVVISFRNQHHVAFEAMATSFLDVDNEPQKMRVGYTMTQAESLQFEERSYYGMQLNVYSKNGSRATSPEYRILTLSQEIPEAGYGGDLPYTYVDDVYRNQMPSQTSVIDYNQLANKPQINEVELQGNRWLPAETITEEQINAITGQTPEEPAP